MKWKLAIILSLAAVFAAAGVIYLLLATGADPKQLLQNLPGRTIDQKPRQLDRPGFIPNSNIDAVVDAYPYHVMEGTVATLKLRGEGFGAAGFWVRQPDRTVKHLPLEELKDQDYVYVTYFAAPASDTEAETQTISGVVSASRINNDSLFIRLLDDLDNLEYQITPETFFQIEDPSGLFSFVGESYLDIEAGELVKLVTDKTGKVAVLTSVAPRVSIAWGKTKILEADDDGKFVRIGDMQVPVIIDGRAIIARSQQPDKKLSFTDISDDMEVSVIFYADGERLAAKTVEVRSP